MVERTQPLAGIATSGEHGPIGEAGPGVTLSLPPRGSVWQIAAWPESYAKVSADLAKALGLVEIPAPGRLAVTGDGRRVARVEPLKIWVMGPDGAEAPVTLAAEAGATLELGHNDAWVRVTGRFASDLIARLLPLDLRETAFPDQSFATSFMHHMITRLIRHDTDGPGYEIAVMRSHAEDLWDLLTEHGAQFGLSTEI